MEAPDEDSKGIGQAPVRTPSSTAPIAFEVFRGGSLTSWESLFEEAAAFASQIPPHRLISISHSADNHTGVVTVWYRTGGTSDATRESAGREDE